MICGSEAGRFVPLKCESHVACLPQTRSCIDIAIGIIFTILSVCLPVQTTARPGIIALTDMITSMECSDEWTNAARLSHRNLFCVFCEDFYAFYAALFLFTFDKYCFMLQSVCQSASYREILCRSGWGWYMDNKKELFAFRIPKTVQRCYDVAEIVEVGGIVGFYLICPRWDSNLTLGNPTNFVRNMWVTTSWW